jgi:hypothetical protein
MMNRFLVVLLLLVIAVVGLGFYLGWFHVTTGGTDQKSNITIEVDKDKFLKDKDKAIEKVQEAGQNIKEKTGTGNEKAKDKDSQP